MKKSTIKISSNVLKGITEFRGSDKDFSQYDLEGIGFSMDESKGKASSVVRYHVSDAHIGITGTCGEIEGDWLPKDGVVLPGGIYPLELGSEDEATTIILQIDHEGFVTTLANGIEKRLKFDKEARPVPMLKAIPVHFGGTNEVGIEPMADFLISCHLSKRAMKGISYILADYSPAIRVTLFGEMKQVVFTAADPSFDFVAALMPMNE